MGITAQEVEQTGMFVLKRRRFLFLSAWNAYTFTDLYYVLVRCCRIDYFCAIYSHHDLTLCQPSSSSCHRQFH